MKCTQGGLSAVQIAATRVKTWSDGQTVKQLICIVL